MNHIDSLFIPDNKRPTHNPKTRGGNTEMAGNIPQIKMGLVTVSRDCFPRELAERRRRAIVREYADDIFECEIIVENEKEAVEAVRIIKNAGCNALTVFLGNFGPETPETLIARMFDGPCMYVAAAEGDGDLRHGRGDAYCGLLNCSYNLGLRHLKAYIPKYPIGNAKELADKIREFIPVARALIGVRNLKIITFGPRPQDFFACNAPIKGLYDLGVEIQENSELDLYVAFQNHADDPRIPEVAADMAQELGSGNTYPQILNRLAQYELTLLDWAEENKGTREYVAFANKCWPAFPVQFGFEPCYVNSRLASRGIPVGCEVDIYGTLSEYIGACLSNDAVTLLDINNTVPESMFREHIAGRYNYRLEETFMGFHCGNTPACKLCNSSMQYMLIQNRNLENGRDPDFTRGTLEGNIVSGDITFYRLHADPSGTLKAYIAQGEVLPVNTASFGGIGIFAIREMDRFYRYVLIEKHFPHHGAVAFGHFGKLLYNVLDLLSVQDISYNRPRGVLYDHENPFDNE